MCNVQGHAQPEMHPPASMPKHRVSSSRPATAREAAMDLIDLANLKVFGNKHFRPQQKEVIKAALQVSCHDTDSPSMECRKLVHKPY